MVYLRNIIVHCTAAWNYSTITIIMWRLATHSGLIKKINISILSDCCVKILSDLPSDILFKILNRQNFTLMKKTNLALF